MSCFNEVMKNSNNEVVVRSGDEFEITPIVWIWKNWLALGKLHILAGAPGQGKTTLAIKIAATISSGGVWPDGTNSMQGNVLIWSGEDDIQDTLLPRLIASGADVSKCFFVSGVESAGGTIPFDLASDMEKLKRKAFEIGDIKAIIVDPISAAINGDSHKNTEVRRSLQPLVDLANELNAGILGISHFSKSGNGGDPTSRVVGSVAFTALPRIVLVAANNNNRRLLVRSKSNIGPDTGGFEYMLDQVELENNVSASQLNWGEYIEGSASQLLEDENRSSAVKEAAKFLNKILSDGPVESNKIKETGVVEGLAWASIKRASRELKIVTLKGKGGRGLWYWSLPDA